MSNDDGNGYVDQVRANTRRYIRELLDEQTDLRRQLDELRADLLRREREQVAARRNEERFAEIEQQNANLAALYAASYQLHTPRRADVLTAIHEIVINLIGSEELAVLGVAGGELRLLSSYGVEAARLAALCGDAALRARVLDAEAPDAALDALGATIVVPLAVADRPVGAIVVFRLLPQKPRLEPFDHELIGLLASHAATALYCSELAERGGTAS